MNKNCFVIKHWLLVFILPLFCTVVLGQGYSTNKWRFSDPKQFGFTVLDVHFINNNVGIAVGGNGGIATTMDGGAKWAYGAFTFLTPTGLLTNGSFNDVHMASATVAYAVGSNGMMAKSTNAGKDWSFVKTPLYDGAKSINACWFLNKDTGYIGGQFNGIDSIPRIYVTRNGGTTWDSLAPTPTNGKSRVGYISNPNIPSVLVDVDHKAKEIYRIQFLNDSVGYVCGTASPLFPAISVNAVAATCLPSTGTLTGSASSAALLWKITKNVITDYSLSKERLGYTGINTSTVTCTTSYNGAGVTPSGQTYRALNIINDSTVVMMSFNNNCVVRVNTGRNDSTANVNNPGRFERGKYVILNFPFPPSGGPNAGPSIPPTQVLLASNPYQIKNTAAGKLVAAGNFGLMWTSIDTGKNWVREFSLPQGRNYSSFATWALDILPNGKFVSMGQGGVVADSMPGGTFNSNYVYVGATGNKVDFVDCNNGIVTGGSQIAVTTNGGGSWVAKNRPDFANSFYNINGFSYTRLNKAYFAVSNGTIYGSPDQATTLDPIYSDINFQMNDVVGFGTDTIYGLGYSQFSIATASRKSSFFRSTNAGATWQTVDIVSSSAAPVFTAPTLSKMAFPSRSVGYAAGSRNGVYKTTNGGTSWVSINPFPSLNENVGGAFVSYTGICAVDDNTVFVVGNMFTTSNIRRVYKTTDGGTTWTDISGSINTQLPSGNMLNILFSDANNGYVIGSNVMFVTNNSGNTWTMEVAPHGNLQNSLGFAPRTVPAAIPFANRKLFIGTFSFGSGIPSIMEYGDTLNVNINSLSETIVNANCSNLTGGSITLNPVGGLPPYSYSINGGAFQTSNMFTGLTQGAKTITIKDAFCGTITKNITVGFTDNLTLTTTPALDTSVCAGAPVPLLGVSPANTTFAWTPAAGLSATNISNPVATVNANSLFTVTASLNGCVRTKVIPVNMKPNPIVNAGIDFVILIGDQVQLLGSGANNVSSIAWTPAATLTGANSFTPIAKPTQTTTYTLTVKDANNCTSTDDAMVTVIPYCVNPKDAFTPNGDGINDKWVMTTGNSCLASSGGISVKVYNRYGGLVYANENYQNNWDGTYSGKLVADGTYYYQVVYKLFNNTLVNAKGNVTILR